MKKNMQENFDLLKDRVLDTHKVSDLEEIKQKIKSIKGNTICVGAGGSNVVANYASKVISKLNGNLVLCMLPRDLEHINLSNFDNVLIASYSGKGKAVDLALNNKLNKYLLSNNDIKYESVTNITYGSTIEKENSFISLAATLMPMSVLLKTYIGLREPHYISIIEEMFEKVKVNIKWNDIYEIIGGIENSTAIKYLESTMAESGIAVPIVHDKYDFCHGRSTLSYKNNSGLIYLNNRNKELDNLILSEAKKYYTEVVNLNGYYPNPDELTDEFYMTLQAMYLTKKLAENKEEDLSIVDHSPLVYKLYHFKGTM
jgi:hypothetical protein